MSTPNYAIDALADNSRLHYERIAEGIKITLHSPRNPNAACARILHTEIIPDGADGFAEAMRAMRNLTKS